MHWSLLYLLCFNLKSVVVGSFIYSHFIISKRKKIYIGSLKIGENIEF